MSKLLRFIKTLQAANRIAARYVALNQENDLDSVERLFSQMSEYGTDQLKAFLSGWAALEILIAKSFKSYEQAFLSPFTNAEQPTLRERFLVRIKGVMKDKYRLTDKFIAVAAIEEIDLGRASRIVQLCELAPALTEICLGAGSSTYTLENISRRRSPRCWKKQLDELQPATT